MRNHGAMRNLPDPSCTRCGNPSCEAYRAYSSGLSQPWGPGYRLGGTPRQRPRSAPPVYQSDPVQNVVYREGPSRAYYSERARGTAPPAYESAPVVQNIVYREEPSRAYYSEQAQRTRRGMQAVTTESMNSAYNGSHPGYTQGGNPGRPGYNRRMAEATSLTSEPVFRTEPTYPVAHAADRDYSYVQSNYIHEQAPASVPGSGAVQWLQEQCSNIAGLLHSSSIPEARHHQYGFEERPHQAHGNSEYRGYENRQYASFSAANPHLDPHYASFVAADPHQDPLAALEDAYQHVAHSPRPSAAKRPRTH